MINSYAYNVDFAGCHVRVEKMRIGDRDTRIICTHTLHGVLQSLSIDHFGGAGFSWYHAVLSYAYDPEWERVFEVSATWGSGGRGNYSNFTEAHEFWTEFARCTLSIEIPGRYRNSRRSRFDWV